MMKIVARRLATGLVLHESEIREMAPETLLGECRNQLLAYYDHDDSTFRPRPEHFQKAPEEVEVIDAVGQIIARYDIFMLRNETGRELTGNGAQARLLSAGEDGRG